MRITDRSPEIQRANATQKIRSGSPEAAGVKAAQPVASVSRSDRVQISDAGRALAQQGAAAASGSEASSGLTPARTAEIRTRILEGAYNSLEVADQVARRMLERGDI